MKNPIGMLLVCLLFVPDLAVGQANIQKPQVVRETDKWLDVPCKIELSQATFAECLQTLQREHKLTLLADGVPFKANASISSETTLREALDKVADAFDYRYRTSTNRVILLTKRLRDKHESPQIVLAEMQQVFTDMVRLLHQFPFDKDGNWERSVDALLGSLSLQQLTLLRKPQPISGKQLTPPQRSLLQQAIFTNLLAEPFEVWRDLSLKLASWTRLKIVTDEPLAGASLNASPRRYRIEIPASGGTLLAPLNPIFYGE